MKKSKIYITVIFIITILFIMISILAKPLQDGDEFINYFNTYKMFMGERIYREVNIVSTPLLFYFGILIFKIIGSGLISFRVYNIIINIMLLITVYRIFRNLNIRKKHSILLALVIEFILASKPMKIGATYNVLALFFCLIGVNLSIKRDVKYYSLKQGITIFLIFMTKQNIGIYYSIANIIIQLVLNKHKKEGVKSILKIFITPIILFIVYLIYLYIDESLWAFVNYTILGIKEFSKNLLYHDATVWVTIDIASIIFTIVILKNKLYEQENRDNILILLINGIAMLPIGYPIMDYFHMTIGSIVLMISMIYILEINFGKAIKEKIINIILALMVIYMLTAITYKSWIYFNTCCKDSSSKFYGVTIYNDQKKEIDTISEYIKNADKKVIIASPKVGKYCLNLGIKSNGILDFPWTGNLGKNGEQALINKLRSYEDAYILIETKKIYWQEIDEFRNFIKDQYEEIGTIENFSIYYIP